MQRTPHALNSGDISSVFELADDLNLVRQAAAASNITISSSASTNHSNINTNLFQAIESLSNTNSDHLGIDNNSIGDDLSETSASKRIKLSEDLSERSSTKTEIEEVSLGESDDDNIRSASNQLVWLQYSSNNGPRHTRIGQAYQAEIPELVDQDTYYNNNNQNNLNNENDSSI